MELEAPLDDTEIAACVASFRTATAEIERLSPAALSALARTAARFVLSAKRLRRRRAMGASGRGVAPSAVGPAAERRSAPTSSPIGPADEAAEARPSRRRAGRARRCYVCSGAYTQPHCFYGSLCPPCAALNFAKRTQTADLTGRVAVVTGARITSGYATALKLLRAGATVIGTTRFPREAATRFGGEHDFGAWSGRLHLYGLDFRSPAWVDAFAEHLATTFGRLHVLVNNAAQTVRRPAPLYTHLVPLECAPLRDVAARLRPLLAQGQGFCAERGGRGGALSALLSQVNVLPEDSTPLALAAALGGSAVPGDDRTCPAPRDLRDRNSWTLRLGDVASGECLEVLLVNTAAPFILAGRLRELMARDVMADKWIVNVTAVEGQFSRRHKDGRHPHLDMAKAALNMLTRTSADDYARDRIHMNSVDVGWFSNGEPASIAAAMAGRGFSLPLDAIDAAARVCDPIFTGVSVGVSAHGKLLKDYRSVAW